MAISVAFIIAFVVLCAAPAAAQSISKQDLFVNGAKYEITYPCYRQPAIVEASDDLSVLLAFAEGRNLSLLACAPPLDDFPSNEIGGLIQRRSADGGKTWSAPRTIYSGNIDFYTLTRDATTGLIWLMLQQGSNILVFTTGDGGLTWSAPHPLSATPPPLPLKVSAPAVGHGIQITASLCSGAGCSDAGSLVVPFVCTNGSAHGDSGQCPACHSCLLLSSDHGKSWAFGGYGQAGSREAQAVQVPSSGAVSALYVTERNFGPTPGHRMYARSSDGGRTLGDYGIDDELPTPVTKHWTGIVAGALRYTDAASGAQRILYTAPDSPTVRQNLSARVSSDAGKTWSAGRSIYPGLAGYSDLAPLAGGVGIIFENGDRSFSDRISFAVLPFAWLPTQPEP